MNENAIAVGVARPAPARAIAEGSLLLGDVELRVRVFGPNGLPLDPSATNVVLFVR